MAFFERLFAWGGTHASAVSYMTDAHAHLYHDSQPRWGVPAACTLEVPTGSAFIGYSHGAGDLVRLYCEGFAAESYGEMGEVRATAQTSASFYSGAPPLGTRAGGGGLRDWSGDPGGAGARTRWSATTVAVTPASSHRKQRLGCCRRMTLWTSMGLLRHQPCGGGE